MPPKRAAETGAASESRPSTDAHNTNSAPPTHTDIPPPIPRSKRWAAVSGSRNVDLAYKEAMWNPLVARCFVCMCRPPFLNGEDDDEDDEDEDDEENDNAEASGNPKKQPKCDGGKTCLCDKPAAEHPDHAWKFTAAGKRKFFTQQIHCQLRCPDYFGMYTFNDHQGYGVLEVLENLILDFEEARRNHEEQWAVCECLALFLATDNGRAVTRIDDGDCVDAMYELIGRLFMSVLSQLERKKLLSKDSPIINLGLVMALFMDFARGARDYGLLEDDKEEVLGQAKDRKKWQPHFFDDCILAYARKYDIKLVGPHNIDEIVADADPDVDLPVEVSSTSKADPFRFKSTLEDYKVEYGGGTAFLAGNESILTPIGGDNLDITAWSSAKRKSKAFDKEDPLGEEERAAIREGLVLSFA